MKVEFYRHNLDESDLAAVQQVLGSLFLTTGAQVTQFESDFARFLNARHAIGLTSCTAALQLALLALGIGPGDEVIAPAMTFIATPNTVLHVGATPVLVDVEPETGNIDARRIEAAITPRTRAIIPVHLYGQMCDMREIRRIADRHGLAVVEDCAHCIEGSRDGVVPGQLAEASCFSFYATKNITSGEGGALVTNDDGIAEKVRVLRLHGMTKSAAERYSGRYEHWDMTCLGYKYNMSNIQAALLIHQLRRIGSLLEQREAVARRYEQAFASVPGVRFPRILEGVRSARHLFTIWVDPARRDAILADIQRAEIGVAVNYRALHLLEYYRKRFGFSRGAFPVAESIGDSTLTLPLYPKLTMAEQDHVIATVTRAV